MEQLFKQAIQYVKEHKDWSDAEEQVALEKIDHYRCNIDFAAPSISDKIHDLMEEFSDENDLPEGWWYEFGDEDDIFFALGD